MFYDIGSITLLKNIVFKSKITFNSSLIDHATSRPAVIISEDNNNTYFLLFTSSKIEEDKCNSCQYFHGKKGKNQIGGYINLMNIYKRNICYRNEIDFISDEKLQNVLEKFCYYQENICMDIEYPAIKEAIYLKINELKAKSNQKVLKR